MKLESLRDLYVEHLKDLYNAEQQLIKALPKMAKAASSEELKAAFEDHLGQTRQHAQRIETIFEQMGEKAIGKDMQGNGRSSRRSRRSHQRKYERWHQRCRSSPLHNVSSIMKLRDMVAHAHTRRD
jgi:hypothetical protein